MQRRFTRFLNLLALVISALILSLTGGWAQTALQSAYPVDVTPCGFAVIWEGQPGTTPGITIFSDKEGKKEITRNLRTALFPLCAGDPELEGDYPMEMDMAALREQAANQGLMKIRVDNCQPETTYYYRIHCQASNGDQFSWPLNGTAAVTTTRAHGFIPRGNQLMVHIDDPGGLIDMKGWIVMAFCCENEQFGVSALVGEGAGDNQACLNISNLFGYDGLHWSPSGSKEIIIEIRRAYDEDPIRKRVILDFDTAFSVAEVFSVNIDALTGETIGLADLIRVLNLLTRAPGRPFICDSSMIHDRDGNGSIDMSEALYILQLLSELRQE